MKRIILVFFVITCCLLNNTLFAWGEKGHALINKKAVEALPNEMNGFKKWINYLVEHASDPDKRRDYDSTEFNKHFIDIDYYKEFRQGNMVKERDKLISLYSDSVVSGMGILPWATLAAFNNLIQAFKEKDRDKALIYATDLGHYVGDAHQPMHNIMNYDGQMTDQKGIHARYEEYMIDRVTRQELDSIIEPVKVSYIKDPPDYIFNYITNSNSVAPVLFDADIFAFKEAGNRDNEMYYNLLWFRTKYITKIMFNSSVQDLASLIYTAWINAGKPSFKNFQ
jgi:hypothetical protein